MFICHVSGNLGKDPEVKFTPSGQKLTSLNLAVSHRKGKESVTIWIKVLIWGDRFDKMITYLKKGSNIIVVGRMNPPTAYMDKSNAPKASLEIVAEMIEFGFSGNSDKKEEKPLQVYEMDKSKVEEFNDELPF